MSETTKAPEKNPWEEFRQLGLLWWVNRTLHIFGWAIVVIADLETGAISDVYPARVTCRGFSEYSESDGFIKLTRHIADIAPQLVREVEET